MATAAAHGRHRRCRPRRSWNTPRAIKYREINRITGLRGTAVNIQTMVYGNVNDGSGTGVCFSRNPATGEKALFGEFLLNAQVGAAGGRGRGGQRQSWGLPGLLGAARRGAGTFG
jgi:hypothetical protein